LARKRQIYLFRRFLKIQTMNQEKERKIPM
jgi:hypothetical protein